MLSVDQVSLERIAALPRVDAATDVLTCWIEIVDEIRDEYREQAMVEAQRGDTDAAIYADCAAEFCGIIIDRMKNVRSVVGRRF